MSNLEAFPTLSYTETGKSFDSSTLTYSYTAITVGGVSVDFIDDQHVYSQGPAATDVYNRSLLTNSGESSTIGSYLNRIDRIQFPESGAIPAAYQLENSTNLLNLRAGTFGTDVRSCGNYLFISNMYGSGHGTAAGTGAIMVFRKTDDATHPFHLKGTVYPGETTYGSGSISSKKRLGFGNTFAVARQRTSTGAYTNNILLTMLVKGNGTSTSNNNVVIWRVLWNTDTDTWESKYADPTSNSWEDHRLWLPKITSYTGGFTGSSAWDSGVSSLQTNKYAIATNGYSIFFINGTTLYYYSGDTTWDSANGKFTTQFHNSFNILTAPSISNTAVGNNLNISNLNLLVTDDILCLTAYHVNASEATTGSGLYYWKFNPTNKVILESTEATGRFRPDDFNTDFELNKKGGYQYTRPSLGVDSTQTIIGYGLPDRYHFRNGTANRFGTVYFMKYDSSSSTLTQINKIIRDDNETADRKLMGQHAIFVGREGTDMPTFTFGNNTKEVHKIHPAAGGGGGGSLTIQSVAVANETPSLLEFTFDENVDDNTNIEYTNFEVKCDDVVNEVVGILINGGKLFLALDERVYNGTTITVKYTGDTDDNKKIKAASGKSLDAFEYADNTVTNNVSSAASSLTDESHIRSPPGDIVPIVGYNLSSLLYTSSDYYGSKIASNMNVRGNNQAQDYLTNKKYNKKSHGKESVYDRSLHPKIVFPSDSNDPAEFVLELPAATGALAINSIVIQQKGGYTHTYSSIKALQIYGSNTDFTNGGTFIETLNIRERPTNPTTRPDGTTAGWSHVRNYRFNNTIAYKKYRFVITQAWTHESADGDNRYGQIATNVFYLKYIPNYTNEEQAVVNAGGSADDLTTLKANNFGSVVAGKGNSDTSTRSRIRSLIAAGTDAANKRARRRSILKLLFAQNTAVKRMVIPKDDLNLSANFKKTNALVVKAGETFDIQNLAITEGFYAVLDDTEDVNIKLENVTVKFTRDDEGGQERYEVSMVAGAFGDMTINSDDVTGGNFSESNTSGYLVPDDVVVLDGRKITIGSIEDGGNAGSAADPYVFSINSTVPVKLPNKHAFYRFFEQGNNYVNVEVAQATSEHQHRMQEYAKSVTPVTHNVVCDGFFYKKAFISAEGNTLSIDYATKDVECSENAKEFFTIKSSKKTFDCGEFKEDSKCYTISWKTSENKKISTEVMFFPNPHMENGINVIPSTLKKSTGLIVENFKPKLMEIPSLTTESYGKLWRRLGKANKKHQKMSIKSKNETWRFA